MCLSIPSAVCNANSQCAWVHDDNFGLIVIPRRKCMWPLSTLHELRLSFSWFFSCFLLLVIYIFLILRIRMMAQHRLRDIILNNFPFSFGTLRQARQTKHNGNIKTHSPLAPPNKITFFICKHQANNTSNRKIRVCLMHLQCNRWICSSFFLSVDYLHKSLVVCPMLRHLRRNETRINDRHLRRKWMR